MIKEMVVENIVLPDKDLVDKEGGNKVLYEYVAKEYILSLTRVCDINNPNKDRWQCTPNGKMALLLFYNDNKSKEFFTHELLHLYLFKKGFAKTEDVVVFSEADNYVMSSNLIGAINNVFAHEKMYAEYIKMKFDPSLFKSENSIILKLTTYKAHIQNSFFENGLPNVGINDYIESFFFIKDNRNPDFKQEYDQFLKYLYNKDKALYLILEETWNKWKSEKDLSANKTIFKDLSGKVSKWHQTRT